MNKELLKHISNNIHGWFNATQGFPTEKKWDVLLISLADLCEALATDSEVKEKP